jgi:hypothetical protein
MGSLAVILLAILVMSNRGLRKASAERELVSDLPPQEIQTDKPS